MAKDRIVALGLLTRRDVELLGPTFTRLWPVDESPDFDGLLEAINAAERELSRTKPDPSPNNAPKKADR